MSKANVRGVTVEIGGVTLPLRFEAENMMELTAITGEQALAYIGKVAPRRGETKEQVFIRCADLAYLVPLLMAGLAHLDEYAGLDRRELRRRVCGLIDAESQKLGEPYHAVAARLVGTVLPVAALTLTPPGTTVDDIVERGRAEVEEEANADRPLPEAEPFTKEVLLGRD